MKWHYRMAMEFCCTCSFDEMMELDGLLMSGAGHTGHGCSLDWRNGILHFYSDRRFNPARLSAKFLAAYAALLKKAGAEYNEGTAVAFTDACGPREVRSVQFRIYNDGSFARKGSAGWIKQQPDNSSAYLLTNGHELEGG